MGTINPNNTPQTILKLVLRIILPLCLAIKIEAETAATTLPLDEIKALKEIARELGKKDWNFSVDPCSWNITNPAAESVYNSTLTCNCSFTGGVCHVQNISLKGQDLSGVLPPSLAKLPYIKQVDFSRNYLSGTIPHQWVSTKLEYLAVTVNKLSGQIPTYLGKITTLIFLELENNMFSGTVPKELGNLVNLNFLNLDANSLTGELPKTLVNLTKLETFKISSNNFTGRIPDFIKNWKSLKRLEILASGLEGPIPSSTISVLKNFTELIVSDLNNGDGSKFPLLKDMDLQRLVLRSCNLFGPIPAYIWDMKNLHILDLSFNKLEGKIPDLQSNSKLEKLYLTSNLLNGTVPNWILGNSDCKIDLSYNNFSEFSQPQSCNTRKALNLFRSFSSHMNSSPVDYCLKNKTCLKDRYSLHINCGGNTNTVEHTNYEEDTYDVDAAEWHIPQGDDSWGISNTGHFWGVHTGVTIPDRPNNVSVLKMNNSQLYTNARVSPLSLTYYAHCLVNGNYTVKLHFSEIVFRDNRSFQSLGRRIFDVYIQEKQVLRNFEIQKEANGVDKAIVKEFNEVQVKNRFLEIRFHWSGKGTTATPIRGIYGPLISAIDVESEFKPPHNYHVLIIVTASISGLCLICIILGILWWKCYFNASREKDLKGLDLHTGLFTLRQIKAATNNFDSTNKIGEGGFGSVYKGTLLDGTIIAVKQLSSKSKQGNREFVNEIGMISALQHPNLVRLYGCCIERNHLLLVYEYMENNSLARALFGGDDIGGLKLDWLTRRNICVGIARGLTFLHEESPLKVVHRDIKTTNVLLDGNLNPKISDFGLAKLDEEENTHISTRIGGTIGYMAPEYALWGYLTYKADVYSFGVVALEVVAGKSNMKYRPNENYVGLVDWALVLQQKGNLMELVDPKLGSDFNKEEVVRLIKVALLCTNPSPALRPTMSAALSMLEGHAVVPELIMDPSIYGDQLRLAAIREQFDQIVQQGPSESQSLIRSSDISQIESSATSSQDLYQISLHSR